MLQNPKTGLGSGAGDRSSGFLDELAASSAPASESRNQHFAALQQHIDELTTEKFELQRGLAQQGKLSATLAAENMQLSEDYNRQVRFLVASMYHPNTFPVATLRCF